MDPLSITGTAVTLTATVVRVAYEVDKFARQVREARRELGDLARELTSLKSATELLAEDLKNPHATAPNELQDILVECDGVVVKLEEHLQRYDKERLSTRIKYVWSGKETIQTYKITLSAHRAALDLAVDIMTLSLSREIKNDVLDVKEGVDATRDTAEEIKADTERILSEIAALQARLPAEVRQRNKVFDPPTPFMLQKYLEELTEYAETVVGYGESEAVADSASVRGRSSTASNGPIVEPTNSIEPLPPVLSSVPKGEPLERREHLISSLPVHSSGNTSSICSAQPGETVLAENAIEAKDEVSNTTHHVELMHSERQEGLLKGFTWDIGLPVEYAQAGLESDRDRKWREEIRLAMGSVTDEAVGPKFGGGYQEGVDFEYELFEYNMTGIKPSFYVHEETRSLAHFVKWMRQLTLSGQFINHGFCSAGDRWVFPLTVALELRDQEWLDGLSAARAHVPKHEFVRLNTKDERDANSAKEFRERWLAALFRTRSDTIRDHREKEVITRATEIVLSTGSRIDDTVVNMCLVRAVRRNVAPLTKLLLKWASDINYAHVSYGTSLRCAVDERRWDLLKVIADAGGDLSKIASVSLWDFKRLGYSFTGTPVELAVHLGQLERLKRALGSEYEPQVLAALHGSYSQAAKSSKPKKPVKPRIFKVFGL